MDLSRGRRYFVAIQCEHCGEVLPREDARFCSHCGKTVRSDTSSSSEESDDVALLPTQPPSAVVQESQKPVLHEQIAHQPVSHSQRMLQKEEEKAMSVVTPRPSEASESRITVQADDREVLAAPVG